MHASTMLPGAEYSTRTAWPISCSSFFSFFECTRYKKTHRSVFLFGFQNFPVPNAYQVVGVGMYYMVVARSFIPGIYLLKVFRMVCSMLVVVAQPTMIHNMIHNSMFICMLFSYQVVTMQLRMYVLRDFHIN